MPWNMRWACDLLGMMALCQASLPLNSFALGLRACDFGLAGGGFRSHRPPLGQLGGQWCFAEACAEGTVTRMDKSAEMIDDSSMNQFK